VVQKLGQAMYAPEGESVGFQLGGQATDVILLVMNELGASPILHTKVKIGANVSVAAGPNGRTEPKEPLNKSFDNSA
jgi:SH3 domain-containing YSC84-like protein 1